MSSKNLLTSIILPLLAVSLVASSVDAKPRQQPAASIQEVPDGRARTTASTRVLVTVNDVVPLRAVIDTGATQAYLPYEIYQRLAARGAVHGRDIRPRRHTPWSAGHTFTPTAYASPSRWGPTAFPTSEADHWHHGRRPPHRQQCAATLPEFWRGPHPRHPAPRRPTLTQHGGILEPARGPTAVAPAGER